MYYLAINKNFAKLTIYILLYCCCCYLYKVYDVMEIGFFRSNLAAGASAAAAFQNSRLAQKMS